LKREQYYLDTLNPEYNILKTAGSLKGFKHSLKTKKYLSKLKLGTFLTKAHKLKLLHSRACPVILKNIESNEIILPLIRKAALFFLI
jgi:hypothetical protein